MWIVAKIKTKEINIFKKKLIEKTGEKIQFYYPKILFKKISGNKYLEKEKPVIEDYIFCFHPIFNCKKKINNLRYLKGLCYFLNHCSMDQANINNFVKHCKKFENEKGYLLPSFFNDILKDKGQFVSGPFKNFIFHILEKHKKVLKIQIGNFTTILSKNKYLYKPV